LEKRILYQVRDIVTLSNCAITGDAHVNVRESRKTALAHAALLDAGDTRHGFNRTRRISVTNSGAACASRTSPMEARSIPTPLKMISPQEKSAAHASACAQAGPPITAAEIPTAAANEVSASER
jgi:hypothetical protein